MTKDTINSLSVYLAVGKKWELVWEQSQGQRAEIGKFLKRMGAFEVDKAYTDLAAYHFYMVFDMPVVKE